MKNIFKSIFLTIIRYTYSPRTLPNYYRKYYGIKIGKGCVFTGKRISFGSEPYLIEIGNKVRITADVKFETHDGAVGIFRDEYPGINIFGRIVVGDNTFIGHNAIIMPGVSIGSNVIIGAGSVVTKNVLSNTVVVGVPARVILTVEQYKSKALKKAVFIKSEDDVLRKIEILSSFSKLN